MKESALHADTTQKLASVKMKYRNPGAYIECYYNAKCVHAEDYYNAFRVDNELDKICLKFKHSGKTEDKTISSTMIHSQRKAFGKCKINLG